MTPGLASLRRSGFVLMLGVLSAAVFAPSGLQAQQVWTGAPPMAGPLPIANDFGARLEAMERELRRLGAEGARPGVDEAVNRLGRELEAMRTDQHRFQADVDRRLRELEARSGAPRPIGLAPPQFPAAEPIRVDPPAPAPFALETRAPSFPQVGQIAPPGALGAPVLRDETPSMPVMGFEGIEVSAGPGVRMPGPAPSLRAPSVMIDAAPDLGDMEFAMSPPRLSAPPTAPRAPAMLSSPQADYDSALRLLETGSADQALEIFGRIVANAPNDPVAGSAQYWIGDIHFRKSEYDLAARAFLESFRRWPEGAKGPESLLRLGMTLAATGKRAEACAAFGQVQARYPGAAPDVLGRARIEGQRNQC